MKRFKWWEDKKLNNRKFDTLMFNRTDIIRNNAYYIAKSCGVKEMKFKLNHKKGGCAYIDRKEIHIGRYTQEKYHVGLHVLCHEIAHIIAPKDSHHNQIWQNINKKVHNMFGLKVEHARARGYETNVEIVN